MIKIKKITGFFIGLLVFIGVTSAVVGAHNVQAVSLYDFINALHSNNLIGTKDIEPARELADKLEKDGVCGLFTRDLTLGSQGDDVAALQDLLIEEGYMISSGTSTPEVTGYFGSITQTALARFQDAHNSQPAVGYFGPITRLLVLKKLGCPNSESDDKDAIEVELIDIDTNVTNFDDDAPSSAVFKFEIEITAKEDVLIPRSAVHEYAKGIHFFYGIDADNPKELSIADSVTSGADYSRDGFELREGKTENFVISVTVQASKSGYVAAYLDKISYYSDFKKMKFAEEDLDNNQFESRKVFLRGFESGTSTPPTTDHFELDRVFGIQTRQDNVVLSGGNARVFGIFDNYSNDGWQVRFLNDKLYDIKVDADLSFQNVLSVVIPNNLPAGTANLQVINGGRESGWLQIEVVNPDAPDPSPGPDNGDGELAGEINNYIAAINSYHASRDKFPETARNGYGKYTNIKRVLMSDGFINKAEYLDKIEEMFKDSSSGIMTHDGKRSRLICDGKEVGSRDQYIAYFKLKDKKDYDVAAAAGLLEMEINGRVSDSYLCRIESVRSAGLGAATVSTLQANLVSALKFIVPFWD